MKSINKALIYRDWKYTKWLIPIIFFILFCYNIPFLISKNSYGVVSVYDFGYNVGTWVVVAALVIMVSIMFSFDRNLSSYSLAASMPFTKKEIIISKWFAGVYNIFIPYFSIYIIMNAMLIVNNSWLQNIGFITFRFTTNLMFSLCVFSFILMIQAINGSVFLGSFISLLFISILYSIVHILNSIYGFYSGKYIIPAIISDTYGISNKVLGFAKLLLNLEPLIDAGTLEYLKYNQTDELMGYVKLDSILGVIGIAVYFAALIIMLKLSIKFFSKSKPELNGRITTVEGASRVYKLIVAYYTGYLLHALFSIRVVGTAFRLDYVVLFYFIIPIPFYFLIGSIIRLFKGRYD